MGPTRRRWPRILLAATGGLLALSLALWLALRPLLALLIENRLAAAGLSAPSLRVGAVGLERLRLEDVRIGAAGELTVAEVAVDYDLRDLPALAIEAVTVRGLRAEARLDDGRIAIAGIEEALAGPAVPGASDGERPSLPPLHLEDARLSLATRWGTFTIPFSGSVATSADGAILASFDLAAEGESGRGAGRLALTVAGQAVAGSLELAEAAVALPAFGTGRLAGAASFLWREGQLARLSAELGLGDLAAGPARFTTGDLSVQLDGGEARAVLALHDAPGRPALMLDLAVRNLADAPALAASGELMLAADSALWPLTGLPAPQAGRAILSGTLEAGLPPLDGLAAALGNGGDRLAAALRILGTPRASLRLDLDGLDWPGAVQGLSVLGALDIAASAGGALLSLPAAILAEGRPAPAAVAALDLPDDLAAQLAGPVALALGAGSNLRLTEAADGLSADGRLLLSLTGAAGLAGRLDWTGRLGPAEAEGSLETEIETPALAAGGIRAEGLTLEAALDLAWREALLTLTLPKPGRLRADRLAVARGLRATAVDAALSQGEAPALLTLDLSSPGLPRLAHDLVLGPLRRLEATVGDAHRLALTLPRLRIAGAMEGGASWRGTVSLSEAAALAPTAQIAAEGISAELELGDGLAARYRIARLADRHDPAWLVPLAVTGTARVAGDELAFAATAADARERLRLSLSGRHDLGRGAGRARVELQPILFQPNLVEPEQVSPAAAALASEVTGTIALAGEVAWDKAGLRPDLQLLLRDLSLSLPAARLEQINAVVALDGLAPPTTPPGQKAAVALIEAGLPLTEGLLTFQLLPGPRLRIEEGSLRLAGGTVSVEPVTLDPAEARQDLRLAVEDVDLGQMLALADIEGLTGTGRLDGLIPVTLAENDVVIKQGELAAESPGRLAYAPLAPPAALQGGGETTTLVLSALTDFQYEDLRMTLNREAGGEMLVGIHIRGKNPEFYEGYPVELNLNVTGKLDQILRRGLTGYRVPEAIRERFMEFGLE